MVESRIGANANLNHSTIKMTNIKLCFFEGGGNKVMIYDLQDETWNEQTIDKPDFKFNIMAAAVTLPNGDCLITGGDASTTVYQYSVQTNNVIEKKSMNQGRCYHAAVICGNTVFVMGGYCNNDVLYSCEAYNVHKDEWQHKNSMIMKKSNFSATVVNDQFIYTFGGDDNKKSIDVIEKYDIAQDTWELLEIKLNKPNYNSACFSPEPNKVVILSGFSTELELIDLNTNQWERLPNATARQSTVFNKLCFIDNIAYFVYNNWSSGLLNGEKFDYKKNKWISLTESTKNPSLIEWCGSPAFIPQEIKEQTKEQQDQGEVLLQVSAPQDAIENFLKNSAVLHIDLQPTILQVQETLEQIVPEKQSDLQDKSIFTSLYPSKKANYHQEDYPDIFREMFLSYDKRQQELKKDNSEILLFLLAFSQGTIDQRLDCLIQVLENSQTSNARIEADHSSPRTESENVSKERATEIFQRLLLLSSVEILQAIQNQTYLSPSEMYTLEELEQIRAQTSQLTDELIQDLFQGQNEVNWQQFHRLKERELSWLLYPQKCCRRIIENAKLEIKHVTYDEGNRELQRKQKKQDQQTQLLKVMKEKFQQEEEKKKAVSEAMDKVIHDENDLSSIIKEIEHTEVDRQRDKFTKKYAFLAQNATYKSKTGLNDLFQTQQDLLDILETTADLGIDYDNHFKVIDSNWEYIESEFLKMKEKIKPHVEILGENTGIGSKEGVGGIAWKRLKDIALALVDKGVIEVHYENDIPIVDIEKLQSIEIKLSKEVISDFRLLKQGKKLSPLKKMKLNGKLLNIAHDRIMLTKDDDQDSINLFLRKVEKIILGRYIQNELYMKDFINKLGRSQQIKDEILLFAYFAGHGCGDTKRIFVLNEADIDKVFWPAEDRLIKFAKQCGQGLKVFVVFDTCWEPKATTQKQILKFHDFTGQDFGTDSQGLILQEAAKLEQNQIKIEEELDQNDYIQFVDQNYRGTSNQRNDAKKINYFSIHGTSMGELVKADSKLTKEFHQQLFVKSTNFQGLVKVPSDFNDMRGYDNKITKTNQTDEYCFEFGNRLSRSHLDQATKALFEAYSTLKNAEGTKIDLLQHLDDYFQNCLTLDDKIIWETVKQESQQSELKPFTLCVLGECGQGKSTLLTKVSQIFSKFFAQSTESPLEFKASKSAKTVTQHVRVANYENMQLIDTPGLNDPNRSRTDKQIFIDLVSTIRQSLLAQEKGITSFIQCIMQDHSERIRDSVLNAMLNLLLILSVFNSETKLEDLKIHPSFIIVFNNVSKYKNQEETKEKIASYRSLLTEKVQRFYCSVWMISDETEIFDGYSKRKWKDIKLTDYRKEPWFINLTDFDKKLLESLDKAQQILGETNKPLDLQYDPAKMEELENKVNYLFPDENFYFFNTLGERPHEEDGEIRRLINNSIKSDKYYIKKGNLEPIHHQEKERAHIIQTLQDILLRCTKEINDQINVFASDSGESVPLELKNHLVVLIKLNDQFKSLVRDRPWALQKVSLHGITLVKECIQNIKGQCQSMIQQSWQKRNEDLQQMIKNYQEIQDSNLKGKISVQYHEETKGPKPEQDQVSEENKSRKNDQDGGNLKQVDQNESPKNQEQDKMEYAKLKQLLSEAQEKLQEQEKIINEKDQQLTEKDQQLNQKDQQINENHLQISEKDKQNIELREKVERLQAQNRESKTANYKMQQLFKGLEKQN